MGNIVFYFLKVFFSAIMGMVLLIVFFCIQGCAQLILFSASFTFNSFIDKKNDSLVEIFAGQRWHLAPSSQACVLLVLRDMLA